MTDKILVVENLKPKQIDYLVKLAGDYEVVQSLEGIDPQSVKIIFGWKKELVPFIENDDLNVKWVQFLYAGVEHLPLELFKEKNIKLTNGSGTNAHAVTETTMGLILAMTRNIIKSSKNQQIEKWDDQNDQYELKRRTLLIVGAGRIGQQLGKVAQAFDMKTIGINRSGRKVAYMNEQYLQSEISTIIGQADIVVNILPDTSETVGFFNADLFSKMKDQAMFVNVGRGETMVTDDLLEALDKGKLSRVALDVFEEEPLPAGHPLWSHEKVLMTPHIAGQVENKITNIFPVFKENFKAFQNGQKLPKNVVELDTGY